MKDSALISMREKIISEFRKEIDKLRKNPVKESDINEYFELIKENIQNDIKDGHKDIIARNLTLGIGLHSGDYPKQLILNGNKEGWKYITRFLLWEKHILEMLFSYKEVTPRSVGCIIGLSALWGMDDLAKLSRSYFQLIFENDREKYRKKETHHLFMALLYDLKQTKEINQDLYQILTDDNAYKKFLNNWNSDNKSILENLFIEICDFHIYSSLDLKGKFSEILSLNYIPYDIRLILKIREEQGLSTINFNHPLMQTPLAEIPNAEYEWDLNEDVIYQFLIDRENKT